PYLEPGSYDFSFSGLKSAVINTLHNHTQKGLEVRKEDVARSFQESVVDVLTRKTMDAVEEYKVSHLLVAGGVAANSGLRQRSDSLGGENDVKVSIPGLQFCPHHGPMVGAAPHHLYQKDHFASLDLNGRNFIDIELFV